MKYAILCTMLLLLSCVSQKKMDVVTEENSTLLEGKRYSLENHKRIEESTQKAQSQLIRKQTVLDSLKRALEQD